MAEVGGRIPYLGEGQDYGTWTYLFTHDFMRLKGILIMYIGNSGVFPTVNTSWATTQSDIDFMTSQLNNDLTSGAVTVNNLGNLGADSLVGTLGISSNGDSYNSKLEDSIVVDNSDEFRTLKVESLVADNGLYITLPDTANNQAADGWATHGIFHESTEFLLESAEKYATLDDGEMFLNRNIDDKSFIKNTLDFFTGGNYTQEDYDKLQEQMTDVIIEMAELIKNGEEVDSSKLSSTVTVAGVDLSFGELLDTIEVGKSIQSVVYGAQSGSSGYGEIGIAQAMVDYYGSNNGEFGAVFASAMSDLCEKGFDKVYELKTADWGYPPLPTSVLDYRSDMNETYSTLTELFSKLDTTSKESMESSFKTALAEAQKIMTDFGDSTGTTSSLLIVSDTAKFIQRFDNWMSLME